MLWATKFRGGALVVRACSWHAGDPYTFMEVVGVLWQQQCLASRSGNWRRRRAEILTQPRFRVACESW